MFGQSDQESNHSNTAINRICDEISECTTQEDPDLVVEKLRHIDANLVCQA